MLISFVIREELHYSVFGKEEEENFHDMNMPDISDVLFIRLKFKEGSLRHLQSNANNSNIWKL